MHERRGQRGERHLGLAEPKRQAGGGRFGLGGLLVAQGLDVGNRGGVAQLGQAFREQGRLHQPLRGRRLLRELPGRRPEVARDVERLRLRPDALPLRRLGIRQRRATRDDIDGHALARHAFPVDRALHDGAIGPESRRLAAQARQVEHLGARQRAREGELHQVAIVGVHLLAARPHVASQGGSRDKARQRVFQLPGAPGPRQRGGERLLADASAQAGRVQAPWTMRSHEQQVGLVDVPDFDFRKHRTQGCDDSRDRPVVHVVGLHPLQEEPVRFEP